MRWLYHRRGQKEKQGTDPHAAPATKATRLWSSKLIRKSETVVVWAAATPRIAERERMDWICILSVCLQVFSVKSGKNR